MTYSRTAITRTRRVRIRWFRVAGLVVVIAAIVAALGDRLPASSSSPSAAPIEVPRREQLDPDLSRAVRRASTAAANAGVEFFVDSGRRTPEHQEQLFREAVSKYGSEAEAARWVATAETSAHVSGDAVDIGPSAATAWLSERGAAYGLCQIYANEPWHFELRPEAIEHGCPAMYADPTHDPRMQK